MSTERKIVSLACPVCGNEMIQDGKIRLVCDICGAVRGQALPDYSLFDSAPISKEVIDKAFPPIEQDVDKIPDSIETYISDSVREITKFVDETEDEFIFEHISKYCDGVLAHEGITHIPKRLLERALICFQKEHKEEWDVLVGVEKPYYGCIYCAKETGPDGLDGYICLNKERRESWCLPMCSTDHDCSKCAYRVTKEDVRE